VVRLGQKGIYGFGIASGSETALVVTGLEGDQAQVRVRGCGTDSEKWGGGVGVRWRRRRSRRNPRDTYVRAVLARCLEQS
jgi:hypothetical protein